MLSASEKLRLFLRPPGRGILTVSTGGGYAENLLKLSYGTSEPAAVQKAWESSLTRIATAKAAVLGIPSDVGAGMMRGSNFGPIGIRDAYLTRYRALPKDVVDIGDVVAVPQLLHDEMLSDEQKQFTREAIYPGVKHPLAVSPLSIAESALAAIREINPQLKVVILGGDHSVSWPAMVDCHSRFGEDFAVLHFDAHTDLLERRFGVKYCFATWAFHATKLMKPRHLIQVGIRTSAKPKSHWEGTLPVVQVWASEVAAEQKKALQSIRDIFTKLKAPAVYISNDIDGTDASEAPATGTPERDGLSSAFVKQVIETVAEVAPIVGSDITEVAPPLSGRREFSNDATCLLAADYLQLQLRAMGISMN